MNGPRAARAAGVTERRLRYWLDKGLLGEHQPTGSGKDLTVTHEQVQQARALADLTRAGLTLDGAVAFLADATRHGNALGLRNGRCLVVLCDL